MSEAFICGDGRTPIGRSDGSLSSVRADDLDTMPLKALMEPMPADALRRAKRGRAAIVSLAPPHRRSR